MFKGFFSFRWITSERILVGWRLLNQKNKYMICNNFKIQKKYGIHIGIQEDSY